MPEQRGLSRLVELLTQTIQEVRKMASQNKPVNQLFSSLEGPASELVAFFDELEKAADIEHRNLIYTDIAKFVQGRMDDGSSRFIDYLSAVKFLCGETETSETERSPSGKQTLSPEAEDIALIARKNILTIKIHYIKTDTENFVKQKTEIFSIGNSENKATINRIEKDLPWESLPLALRNTFMAENKEIVSFQIYPQEE